MPEYIKPGSNGNETALDSRPPVTRMLDEFLKDHIEGNKENLAMIADTFKEKTKDEVLNDEWNNRYKNYDGRSALMQLERPDKPTVLVRTDLNGRPEKFTSDVREVKVGYSPDGAINKIEIDSRQAAKSKYWTEARLIGFESKGDGSYDTLMKLTDGSTYAASTVDNLRISDDGTITYRQNAFGRQISISMDNSVTREEHLSETEQKQRFTSLPDGGRKLELTYQNGSKLTVLGKPTTIFQDDTRVYGQFGISPDVALLQSPEGGQLVFLPNLDGSYLRAAFDPKGNFSADVLFDKPLPRYIHEISSVQSLKIDWSSFDYKSGVHFNLSGVNYSLKDNWNYYLNLKRDKGR